MIKALRWPGDLNFPCIDLVRLSLVNPAAVELLLAKHSEELLDLLLQNLSPSSKAANQMLALRSLANLFGSEKGVYYFDKALERLLGWIEWLILTLLPILDQSHEGWVLQIAKVPLQISFKLSEPFLAFLVNF